MSKGLEILEDLKNAFIGHCRELKCETNYIQVCEHKFSKIEKELKALEIIKKHIVNKDLDTSGVYLEYCLGLFEPYYSIEIKRGANQIITEKEYDLLKEVLL